MKILHAIDQFGLEYGGSSQVCYQMAKALADRGHEVHIYGGHIGTLYSMPSNVKLSRELRSWRPQIIHVHNYRNFANIDAWAYAKSQGIPYVLQAHGSVATYFQKGLLKKVFDFVVGRKILKDAHRVLALSKGESQQYLDVGVPQNKIVLVPNGIDLKQYDCLPERGRFRERWGISPSTKVVLYLGRIHWMKGIDLLIKSFARLTGDVKLAIVGVDGNYLHNCETIVAELGLGGKVLFTGGLYGEKKWEAYVDADVFVLLSSYETFSIAVLEASACGLPVVVAENCGNVSWMPSAYPVARNVDDVSSVLEGILTDKALATRMGEHGKEIACNFSWGMVAEMLEKQVYSS